jgi:hypothetical protein
MIQKERISVGNYYKKRKRNPSWSMRMIKPKIIEILLIEFYY